MNHANIKFLGAKVIDVLIQNDATREEAAYVSIANLAYFDFEDYIPTFQILKMLVTALVWNKILKLKKKMRYF